jgi:hypothetical protein
VGRPGAVERIEQNSFLFGWNARTSGEIRQFTSLVKVLLNLAYHYSYV